MEQTTLFGDSIKLEKISKLGDNLEKLKEAIDFEIFREAMINAILEEFIFIKLHKKLLTAGNS